MLFSTLFIIYYSVHFEHAYLNIKFHLKLDITRRISILRVINNHKFILKNTTNKFSKQYFTKIIPNYILGLSINHLIQ
jgi:hypothetical protein